MFRSEDGNWLGEYNPEEECEEGEYITDIQVPIKGGIQCLNDDSFSDFVHKKSTYYYEDYKVVVKYYPFFYMRLKSKTKKINDEDMLKMDIPGDIVPVKVYKISEMMDVKPYVKSGLSMKDFQKFLIEYPDYVLVKFMPTDNLIHIVENKLGKEVIIKNKPIEKKSSRNL